MTVKLEMRVIASLRMLGKSDAVMAKNLRIHLKFLVISFVSDACVCLFVLLLSFILAVNCELVLLNLYCFLFRTMTQEQELQNDTCLSIMFYMSI